ncbi:MAG TPA: ABC transporter ATP-binding protein [Candidatus Coprovivens excrementavium]|nr:ABC transporter ATP-binding protein [Candidatus Coprovivens excrementavium]
MSLLEVKNINKYFGKKQVIKNVSFSLEEGEILGFIGPNGAGKTTTIKVILGLQSLNSGEVLINGYSIKNDFEKAILNVGAIVESPDLYMYLTGRKNLEMIAAMYKDTPKERINEIIKLVGLDNRIDDKVSKYSLGMRQRLGIAAALIHKPNLLILDEPTNGLDPEGIKELRDLLQRLAKNEKMGVLISSHNLLELESFVTDVCLIKNGEIIVTSAIKDIKRTERTVYTIRLDRTTNIENILNDGDEVLDNKFIKVYRDEKDIPSFIELLVKKKYKIYEVRENLMSLEEAFLKKAGGNIID